MIPKQKEIKYKLHFQRLCQCGFNNGRQYLPWNWQKYKLTDFSTICIADVDFDIQYQSTELHQRICCSCTEIHESRCYSQRLWTVRTKNVEIRNSWLHIHECTGAGLISKKILNFQLENTLCRKKKMIQVFLIELLLAIILLISRNAKMLFFISCNMMIQFIYSLA